MRKIQTIDPKPAIGQRVLLALILYCCLLVFHGYIFGYGDQIEIVPVLYQIDHPEIYTADFYIQQILDKPVHERWFFIHFLHFFGLFHPVSFFLLHAFFSVLLILGLDRIASLVVKAPILRWISILFILLLTYNINLGGNELYYNSLIPSVMAKALAIWGIYQACCGKWYWAVPLFVSATYVQPLVGIHVILLSLLSSIRFERNLDLLRQDLRKVALPVAIIAIFVMPWLYLLFREHSNGDISPALLFEIIEFRLPHHFMPAYFSVKGYLLLPLLGIIAIVVFNQKKAFFSRFVTWVILGCLVYALGVSVFEWPLFLSTQWFKTTIWLKAFGFFALFHLVERWLLLRAHSLPAILMIYRSGWITWTLPVFALIALAGIRKLDVGIMENRPYDFPWGEKWTSEKEISNMAGELSEAADVFIVPPSFTMFKWYSKRNSFVDYKAMIHHQDVLANWYDRIHFAYDLNLETRRKTAGINHHYMQYLQNVGMKKIQEWAKAGVDYLVTWRDVRLPLEIAGANKKYVIYDLKAGIIDAD